MSMPIITIGRLSTVPLQDHKSEAKEIGMFEMPITINEPFFRTSGDKKTYVKLMISHHLAHAIESTKVPSDYWQCELLSLYATELNLPQSFSFRAQI